MKNTLLMTSAVLTTMLVAGCNQSDQTDTASTTNSVATTVQNDSSNAWQNIKAGSTQAWSNVKAGTLEAWADIKESLGGTGDYTYDQKDKFVANAQADMDKLDQKIKEWSDQAAAAGDSAKADAQVKLQQLKAQRVVLDQKLDDAKAATAANWDDTKAAFKQSYEDTKSSLKSAWDWLRSKMS